MRRRTMLLVLLATSLTASACLLSETKVMQVDAIRDGHRGQPIDVTGGAFGQTSLALGDVDTYERHRADLKLVERVGFEATIENVGGTDTSISMYFSSIDSLVDPVGEGTLLVRGLDVPAAGRVVEYEESEALVQNFAQLQKAVRDGDFTVYYVADGAVDVSITSMLFVIGLTVGL